MVQRFAALHPIYIIVSEEAYNLYSRRLEFLFYVLNTEKPE